jgi:hypothetical protein
MKHYKKKFDIHNSSNLMMVLYLIVGTFIIPSMMNCSYGENIKPATYPADSRPYGLTYGDWTARFWQWLYSIPKPDNPGSDTTGKNCGLKQSGPVWFLAGTYGGTIERTCTIPRDKAIMLAAINVECDFTEHQLKNEGELHACAKADQDKVTSTVVSVDGVEIKTVRLQSPLFSLVLPENNALGTKPQTTPAVSDGYWVFLQPLSPGSHTIRASGSLVDFTATGNLNFASNVIYHLIIK